MPGFHTDLIPVIFSYVYLKRTIKVKVSCKENDDGDDVPEYRSQEAYFDVWIVDAYDVQGYAYAFPAAPFIANTLAMGTFFFADISRTLDYFALDKNHVENDAKDEKRPAKSIESVLERGIYRDSLYGYCLALTGPNVPFVIHFQNTVQAQSTNLMQPGIVFEASLARRSQEASEKEREWHEFCGKVQVDLSGVTITGEEVKTQAFNDFPGCLVYSKGTFKHYGEMENPADPAGFGLENNRDLCYEREQTSQPAPAVPCSQVRVNDSESKLQAMRGVFFAGDFLHGVYLERRRDEYDSQQYQLEVWHGDVSQEADYDQVKACRMTALVTTEAVRGASGSFDERLSVLECPECRGTEQQVWRLAKNKEETQWFCEYKKHVDKYA